MLIIVVSFTYYFSATAEDTPNLIKTYAHQQMPKPIVIYFYSESCGYCNKFSPIYAQLKNNYANSFDYIAISNKTFNTVSKNDPMSFYDYMNYFGVRAFPTIVIYNPLTQKSISYRGYRAYNEITPLFNNYLVENNITLNNYIQRNNNIYPAGTYGYYYNSLNQQNIPKTFNTSNNTYQNQQNIANNYNIPNNNYQNNYLPNYNQSYNYQQNSTTQEGLLESLMNSLFTIFFGN